MAFRQRAPIFRIPPSEKCRTFKSGITPQMHRAGREAEAIKPVRRASWEWAARLSQQQRAAWAGFTCAGVRISFLSFFLLFSACQRVSSILPPSRSAARLSASKCSTWPRLAGALCSIFTLHSLHRVENFHVSRIRSTCRSLRAPNSQGMEQLVWGRGSIASGTSCTRVRYRGNCKRATGFKTQNQLPIA